MGTDRNAAPRTESGQRMIDWLNHMQKRTGWAGVPGTPAVARIEAEARQQVVEQISVNAVVDILGDAESDGIIGPDYTPERLARYIVDSLELEEAHRGD